MLFIMLLLVCVYFAINIAYMSFKDTREERKFTRGCLMFLASLVGLTMASYVLIISNSFFKQDIVCTSYELVPITQGDKGGDCQKGELLNTYVFVDEEGDYNFFYKQQDNSIKMVKTSSNNAVILEDDNDSPHIVEYVINQKIKKNYIWVKIFVFPWNFTTHLNCSYEIHLGK